MGLLPPVTLEGPRVALLSQASLQVPSRGLKPLFTVYLLARGSGHQLFTFRAPAPNTVHSLLLPPGRAGWVKVPPSSPGLRAAPPAPHRLGAKPGWPKLSLPPKDWLALWPVGCAKEGCVSFPGSPSYPGRCEAWSYINHETREELVGRQPGSLSTVLSH